MRHTRAVISLLCTELEADVEFAGGPPYQIRTQSCLDCMIMSLLAFIALRNYCMEINIITTREADGTTFGRIGQSVYVSVCVSVYVSVLFVL